MKINSNDLKKLYVDENLGMGEVAERFGVSRSTIRYQLILAGIPLHEKSTIDREVVKKLYEGGLSPGAVAKELGHSQAGVRMVIKELGLRIRDMKESHSYRTEAAFGFTPTAEILQKMMDDSNGNAILAAESCGVKYSTFYGFLRKFGIERKGVRTASSQSAFSKSRSALRIEREKILQSISIRSCEVCREDRSFDMSHIKPNRDGGPMERDNILLLCPSHHDFFDRGLLTKEEFEVVKSRVRFAENKYRYQHPLYIGW